MNPNFLLKMKAKDKKGSWVESTREIVLESAINDTAWLLTNLAVMEGLTDIQVVGVAHIIASPSQN